MNHVNIKCQVVDTACEFTIGANQLGMIMAINTEQNDGFIVWIAPTKRFAFMPQQQPPLPT